MNHIITHWITSLGGTAIGGAVFAVLQSGCGTHSWGAWVVAALPVLLGFIAKDPNKS